MRLGKYEQNLRSTVANAALADIGKQKICNLQGHEGPN